MASPRTVEFFKADRPGESVQLQIAGTVSLLALQPGTDEPKETKGSVIVTNFRVIFKPASTEKDWGKSETLVIPLFSIKEVPFLFFPVLNLSHFILGHQRGEDSPIEAQVQEPLLVRLPLSTQAPVRGVL